MTSTDTGPRRWGGLLRRRDFRLFWAGETVSAVGTSVTRLALPFVAVVTLDATTFQVSLLTAATWLPWLVVGLPAGAWVDRLPRRPILVGCDILSLGLLLTVPVAAAFGVLTVAQLLGVALLVGAAAVFFQTAYQVYLPELVAPADLPEANGKLQGSESAAQVAGPSLAGLIAQFFGALGGLLLDSVTFAVSAVCLLFVRAEETVVKRIEDGRPRLRTQIRDGLRFVLADPYLRVIAVAGSLSNLALTGYQSILILFLVRDVGADPGTVGLLLSGASVGGLIGAFGASTVAARLGTARGLLIANLLAGPFALLIPLTAGGPLLAMVVVGGIGVGVTVVVGNVLKVSFRQSYTPRHLLGRTVVSMQFLNYGTIPLGALLGGAVGTALGLRPAMWIMTGAFALTALLLLIGPAKRNRDFPAQPRVVEPPRASTGPPAAASDELPPAS